MQQFVEMHGKEPCKCVCPGSLYQGHTWNQIIELPGPNGETIRTEILRCCSCNCRI